MNPVDATEALRTGELTAGQVIDDLVEATVNALACYDRIVLAHLFSILPKCGLSEEQVPDASVRRLGDAVRRAGAVVEVNEKWTCPSARVAEIIDGCGVRITLSTDAHHESRVGRYSYVEGVAREVERRHAPEPAGS